VAVGRIELDPKGLDVLVRLGQQKAALQAGHHRHGRAGEGPLGGRFPFSLMRVSPSMRYASHAARQAARSARATSSPVGELVGEACRSGSRDGRLPRCGSPFGRAIRASNPRCRESTCCGWNRLVPGD
jgi:hypothetical protein